MNTYTIYWLDGTSQVVRGKSIADALNKHCSADALAAMDFYEHGDNQSWSWDKELKEWIYVTAN